MFEKEAEEFERRKHYRYEDNDYCGDIADGIIQAYQQGAEFGYNKAKGELEERNAKLEKENEDMKKQIEQMKRCSNCKNFNRDFELCFFSGGDEDYDCRNRRWELAE